MSHLLDSIEKPNDIKKIKEADYPALAKEIRNFLLQNVSRTGGHLASNLGCVELTMALHLAMDFPEDKLIFDVGHQSYTHKLLTGRKENFSTLRSMGGMSGFPKRRESECDAFDTGHSSTSLSVAAGMARARDLAKEKYKVAAVIGDGALSGGMAYEALNNLGGSRTNLLIVLNDNKMSISENVGGMASYLGKLRTNEAYTDFKDELEKMLRKTKFGTNLVYKLKRSKDSIKHFFVPGMFFEDMGITYIGPIDGSNVSLMTKTFQAAFAANKPVLVHVITEKGKGYEFARKNPSLYHGIDAFDLATGKVRDVKPGKSYTSLFSEAVCELAKQDDRITAITAAMPQGTGLEEFSKKYPERFFDVGIAEEHAVTFAAGMAAAGQKPIVAVYSTFLQRAYDQIVHDVCIGELPVVFAIDRAGIVGNDGETHQGILDLSYLTAVPKLTVMAPANANELKKMLSFAVSLGKPVAIRYPRGVAKESQEECAPIAHGKAVCLREGTDAAVFAIGNMVDTALLAAQELEKDGIGVRVVNMRFAAPIDWNTVLEAQKECRCLVTLEENIQSGGMGEKIAAFLAREGSRTKLRTLALPDDFMEHGTQQELRDKYGLSVENLKSTIKKLCER